MKAFKGLLAAALVMASGVASADEWIGPFPVEYIENGGGNLFFMRDMAGVGQYGTTYTSCNRSTILFAASLSDVVVSRTLSIALTAQASGVKVKFLVTGCMAAAPFFLNARAIAIDPAF